MFNLKQKITNKKAGAGTKNVEIMVPLKCLSSFQKTLEMPLLNCENNLIWSEKCMLSNAQKQRRLYKLIQNFMFQLQLFQLKTLENYHNS